MHSPQSRGHDEQVSKLLQIPSPHFEVDVAEGVFVVEAVLDFEGVREGDDVIDLEGVIEAVPVFDGVLLGDGVGVGDTSVHVDAPTPLVYPVGQVAQEVLP
jgi:hypothetical protein